ncbi:MAG: hypothetical protein AAGL29_01105 [Bacteroidota bacterium]
MQSLRTFIAFFGFGVLLIASCQKVGDKKPKLLDFPEYTHNVEYIDSTKARLSEGFKVCNENYIAQYYNPKKATYSKTKKGLRDFILSNYENRGYTDSGYLNIRFVINCEGVAGRYLIHENNLDLEPTVLDADMVEQIFELTVQLKQWNPNVIRGNVWDSYMYLSYRIENGEITEILP